MGDLCLTLFIEHLDLEDLEAMWREAPLLFSSKREYLVSSISSPPRNGFVLDLFYFGSPYVGYVMTRESFDPSLRTLQAARHPLLSSPEHVKHLHKLIEGCGWEGKIELGKFSRFNSALHTGCASTFCGEKGSSQEPGELGKRSLHSR